jgi:cytochrome c-type biogenesis protein CcmH/NrfF
MTPENFLLWAAPVLLLLIGAVVVVRVVRHRAQESDIETDGPEAGQS